MVKCQQCEFVFCLCQGSKCPRCEARYTSQADSPTKVTNLPFIKAIHDQRAVNVAAAKERAAIREARRSGVPLRTSDESTTGAADTAGSVSA